MNDLTPKIEDALDSLIDFLPLKKTGERYPTEWGVKTRQGLKLSILAKLRAYGVELIEKDI